MADKQWKRTERRIAAKFGGKRTGSSGQNLGDVQTPWLCLEVKERRRLPGYILEAVSQARGKANSAQLPAAILHQTGTVIDLVVVDSRDFLDWFVYKPGGDEC